MVGDAFIYVPIFYRRSDVRIDIHVRTSVPDAPLTHVCAHIGAHAPLRASPSGHPSPIPLLACTLSAFRTRMPHGTACPLPIRF